jgi:hypothetical protein
MKALQQLATVPGEALRQPCCGKVRLQRNRVARNEVSIQAHLLVTGGDDDLTQCLSNSVQGIAQCVAPACLVGLRPKQRDERVSRMESPRTG